MNNIPSHQDLASFVFDLLVKHGEELRKELQHEETEFERMVNEAEYIRDFREDR